MPRNNQYNRAKGVADIIFLVDATASMNNCIDGLKANLNSFFTTLSNASANNGYAIKDWRAKIIAFRDIDYNDSRWIEVYPFVRDVEQLRNQLKALETIDSYDWPETLLDALFVIGQMGQTEHGVEDPNKWRKAGEAVRVVAVFTDAEFKPVMKVRGGEGGTVQDVIKIINAEKIKMFLYAPNHPCYDALSCANSVEFQPISGTGLDGLTRDPVVFEQLLKQLAATISVSQPD